MNKFILDATAVNKEQQVTARPRVFADLDVAKQELVYMFVRLIEGDLGKGILQDIFTEDMLERRKETGFILTDDSDALIEKLDNYLMNTELEEKIDIPQGTVVTYTRFVPDTKNGVYEVMQFVIKSDNGNTFERSYTITLLENDYVDVTM